MENTPEISMILAGLSDTSAKKRERTINDLTPALVQDQRVLDALQGIVSRDPVEYVRRAATEKLTANGITPAASEVAVTLKEEGAQKPAIFALGVVGVIVLCLVIGCALVFFAVATSGVTSS